MYEGNNQIECEAKDSDLGSDKEQILNHTLMAGADEKYSLTNIDAIIPSKKFTSLTSSPYKQKPKDPKLIIGTTAKTFTSPLTSNRTKSPKVKWEHSQNQGIKMLKLRMQKIIKEEIIMHINISTTIEILEVIITIKKIEISLVLIGLIKFILRIQIVGFTSLKIKIYHKIELKIMCHK
jgi:hypothetical protein